MASQKKRPTGWVVFACLLLSGCRHEHAERSRANHATDQKAVVVKEGAPPKVRFEKLERNLVYQCSSKPKIIELRIFGVEDLLRSGYVITSSCACVDTRLVPASEQSLTLKLQLLFDISDVGKSTSTILIQDQNGREVARTQVRFRVSSEVELNVQTQHLGLLKGGESKLVMLEVSRRPSDQRSMLVRTAGPVPNRRGHSRRTHEYVQVDGDSWMLEIVAASEPGFFFQKIWVEDESGNRLAKEIAITWTVEALFVTTGSLSPGENGTIHLTVVFELENDQLEFDVQPSEPSCILSSRLTKVADGIFKLDATLPNRKCLQSELTIKLGASSETRCLADMLPGDWHAS